MNWTNTIKVSLLSGILLGAATSQAQVFMPSMEEFGKNRIQRERFEWQVYTTPNFEVYFHGNSRSLATYTAQMAESEFDRITDILSYTPYSRTKIFLYDSPSDLKQSNIGVSLNSEAAIREENLSKSRVQIAFTADHIAFRQKLAKEVSSVFVYDMLYGGSLKDALQSQLLLSLPEWFISGITAYVAEGWSRELDDYMRDVALNKKFKKPAHLSGPEATRVGQSIWNFIAERYGRDNISNILNLTRIIRTEQTSISSTLGISYNRFLSDWRDYYTQMATSSAAAFKSPSGSTLASYPLFTGHKIEQVKLSPNRQWIAYSVMDNGQYHVYLTDTQGQQKTQLLKGGDRFLTRELPVSAPLLAWQDNGTLNVLEQKDDRTLLHQFVESEKKGLRLKARRTVRGFTQIAGFDISQDGSVLAISGDRKGQNDLFLYNLSRNSVLQLTNDLYDDLTPAFVGRSTTRVLFASNRTNDTLSTAAPKMLPNRFNLYLHDGNPRSQVLERLADQALQPMASNGERMFYLSDQQGIQNLFTYDTTSRQARPLSQFVESMTAYDYHPSSGALAYVSIENGRQAVKFLPKLAPVEASETAATGRSIRMNGGVARTNQTASGATDPTKAPVGVGTPSRLNSLRPGEIDTDNYQFDLEGLKVTERRTDKPSSSPRVITNSRSRTTVVRRDATRLKGPTSYKDVFVVNNTDNQFLVLPYLVNQSGFGWQNTITVNDLLENNIIKGGLFITPTFRTSEIFAEYQYLVHRIDFSARFDRRAFTDGFPASGLFTKYRYNRLTLTASYPFTEALRVSASPMYTRLNRVDGSQGGIGLPDAVSSFVGLQGEVVYDNTRSSGMNLLEGTRVKLRAQQQQGMRSNAESFFKITLDARNYTKIYRDLTLATRISFGHSGGQAPKQSILGGIDNWIPFGTVREVRNAENPLNPLNMDYRNVFFTDFVTPLRGFRMNKLSGESYALFNAELRWPVFKVLSRGPLTSTFLQNFQLTAFTDIGTAWTGSGPFSRQNSLNTEIINPQGSPWYATVNNFKNPYLIGYGVGVRTLFLGYYVKGDLAWGVEDTAVQTPIFHVSLGYDF
ncbi:hypothetical protein [Siphonobacter curvatus]|uniref:Translocation protein TolB n=1 Tax=Siphonobacter curvatus TaxID=2094562 RepID=A0A2S7IM26_9BACT|nr:hypothetical protein [Siphonobacter curvatus]PQA58699.1 hypothetical protein C5O19_03275 [Siphonobacter curvatus]